MAISALGGNSHPTSNGSDPSEPGQVHGTLTSSLTDCLCRLIETNAEAQTVKGKREDNLKTASYAPQASEDNHKNLVDPPEDPLLKSICFIETNVVRNGETLIGAETVDLQTASHASQSCGVGAPDGDSNWAGEVRPALDNSAPLSESQPRRGRKRASEATASMASVEREDWLPPGWIVEGRVRSSGASAGSRDKYFIEPITGRRFRSKKEVRYYLETGEVRKKPKKNPDNSPEKGTKSPPLNFNFEDVPDTVKWVRTGSSEGWTPFINGQEVPESSKRDWAAAFEFLALKSSWRPTF
ncbi:hypothetical protein AAG906_032765 [Vitis piasezkii]